MVNVESKYKIVIDEATPVIPSPPDFAALQKATLLKKAMIAKKLWIWGGSGTALVAAGIAGFIVLNPKPAEVNTVKISDKIVHIDSISKNTSPIIQKRQDEAKHSPQNGVETDTAIPLNRTNTVSTNEKIVTNIPKPRIKSQNASTFSVNVSHIPELAVYQGVLFEVKPGQNFEQYNLPSEWDEIRLNKTGILGEYRLILVNGSKRYSFLAFPVFENQDQYLKAMRIYNSYKPNTIINKDMRQ